MNARAARWLTRLYPPAWRARYGEEFAPFLEARPVTLRDVLNVVGCALNERARVLGEFKMSKLQHSLVLAVYAYLAAIAAGLNLYMTVDDTPLVDAMHDHAALSTCWNLVAAGSLVALAAAAALGLPVVWAMIRFAWTAQRRDILVRLAIPPCAAMASIAGLFTWGWNPSRTLIVVVIGLIGSAISLKQAIERTILPEQVRPLQLAKIPAVILACSIVLMAAGVTGWGLLADQYASAAFHARDGFFGTSTSVSWMGSLALFIVSAATALRGARWAITSRTE